MNARHDVAVVAERSSPETVTRQSRLFAESPAAGILGRLPVSVVVFNTAREIVYANEAFHRLLPEGTAASEVLGLRLGEVLACLGARGEGGGCGHSPLCQFCGAGQAFRALHEGQESAGGECHLQCHEGEHVGSLDFRLQAWAMPQGGERFHAAVLTDTRAEKHLALMERIFYHDMLNLVSGMRGICELMRQPRDQAGPRATEVDLLVFTAERVTELIQAQRDFTLAERGDYEVTSVKLRSLSLIEDLAAVMRQESSARGKTLAVDIHGQDVSFLSDRKLVTRILVNMLKNALEATPRGGTVTTGCTLESGTLRLWVRNPGEIPPEARTQIFRRTFSTKGKGRGLGTYSMKLFAENYLEAAVGFTSDAVTGTEFSLRLPLAMGCQG